MKINDVTITEAVYGLDDLKTSISSFASSLLDGSSIDDAKKYAARDRATRLVARNLHDRWKNITYDLANAYQNKLKNPSQDPNRGNQNPGKTNIAVVKQRLTSVIKEIQASQNDNTVVDAIKIILDNTLNSDGSFKSRGSVSALPVLNAWTSIVVNAVANVGRQQASTAATTGKNLSLVTLAKNPNDFGNALQPPFNKMRENTPGNEEWFNNAVIPVQVVVRRIIDDDGNTAFIRYIRIDGQYYRDNGNPCLAEVFWEDQNKITSEVLRDELTRVLFIETDADYPYANDWAIQRNGTRRQNFKLLDPAAFKKYTSATNRTPDRSDSPLSVCHTG